MTEKAIKEFIERLEEASVCFQIHKSDVWSKELDKSRELLLNAFRKQQKEIHMLESAVEEDQQTKERYADEIRKYRIAITNAMDKCKWNNLETYEILEKSLDN